MDYLKVLQLVGCQLVPMQINIPEWTGEQSVNGDLKPTYRRVPSVREQICRSYSVEQIKMTQEAQITGYTLKPARLRMDTCIHTHKYPKEWLFVGLPSSPGLDQAETTSLFPAITAGRWPALACTCCYDPFSEERARDQLRQLHRYRYGKTSTSHSKMMYNSLLPWNISFQVLSFTNNFSLVKSDQQHPGSIQDRSNINTTHKLPRRYQRAASSAAQAGRTPRNQPSPQKIGPSNSRENLVNACNGVQQDHTRRVSVGGKSGSSESELRIEGELLGPCSFGLQETGFRTQQRLSAVTTPVLKRSTVSHAHTMHDIRSMTNTFPNSPSITQSSLFSVPYRSCTGLYASNSNIFDLLGAVKIDFIRLPSPEAVVIRLKAHNRASALESDTSFEEGMATRLFSTNSPVENTPTGYQHLRLRFERHSFRPGSSSVSHRSRHEVCHNQLCNTLGLWIFCKIDLAIHAPMSLGELVDTVSQELSSRCNSLTRKYNDTEQGQRNDGFTSSLRNLQMPSANFVQPGIEGEM
ncbi:hypothetical protein CLF_101481 [Clonorchis sinensis]|uniref:Uncharacterized protein n=1 Tax=Clonorchis sinensis TaxID=79923 RepID=G7Y5U9_CLOSI|nr:hypothetical protein CLF_101481 [Clonorchis sinensis]